MRTLENSAALRPETASSSTKGERKTLFHEILLNKEIEKSVVIDMIAIALEDRHNDKELSDEAFQTLRKSCAKSVSNFVSNSYRPSTAKATYNGDPDYSDFTLDRQGDLLSITSDEAAE